MPARKSAASKARPAAKKPAAAKHAKAPAPAKSAASAKPTKPAPAPAKPAKPAPAAIMPARASAPATAANGALTLRDLNRATLARQLLLARAPLTVPAALTQLAGLQSQWPAPPYVGLWTRLASFTREQLAQAYADRAIVRAPMLRATLHTVTAEDFAQFRPLLQPMFTAAFAGMPDDRLAGIDAFALAAEARPFLEAAPRTQDEVRIFLEQRHPELDVRMMGHAVRLHLPLVQIPGPGTWGFPSAPQFALGDTWTGRPLASDTTLRDLILRYLAAFGPAAPRDFQTWSGLPATPAEFEALRAEGKIIGLKTEAGREVFDVPDAPRPGGDAPAPVRLLAEYDNLVLAHQDRTRFVPDAYRSKVYLPGLRVASTILVDGFVRGAWTVERSRTEATLELALFTPVTKAERDALAAEGEALLAFTDPDVKKRRVIFAK